MINRKLLENILSLGLRLVGFIGPTGTNLYEAVLLYVLQLYSTILIVISAIPVVLKLGSIEPQGFDESVAGVRRTSRN